MPVATSSDPTGRFAVLTITDPYTIDEWRSGMLQIFELPVYAERRLLLVDRTTCLAPSAAFVSQMTDFFAAQRATLSGTRCAILVSSDAGFGAARMTEMQSELRNPDVTMRVFRTRDDAERWLTAR